MRRWLAVFSLCIAFGTRAQADDGDLSGPMAKPPVLRGSQPAAGACNLGVVTHDWDFSVSSHGFWTRECDNGGMEVWEYGPTSIIPDAPPTVWGTILDGSYPNESGSGLISPGFSVTPSSYLVEVYHYFDTEWEYDGCNLVIYPYGTVWPPNGGYTVPTISPSGSYYAWCVDGEAGWTGSSGGWRVDCFDLSDLMDYDIAIEFDFGSDASVNADGWYLARVRIGGSGPPVGVCCDPETGGCTVVAEEVCAGAGGEWHPEWNSCDPNPCPPPPPVEAVCCDPETGGCTIVVEEVCASLSGVWHPEWSSCDPNPCPPPPPEEAVCCDPETGFCTMVVEEVCAGIGGVWHPEWDSCDPNPCLPVAACCFPNGVCVELTEDACAGNGGEWYPDDTCVPNPCQPPEAVCCLNDGTCVIRTEVQCANLNGVWRPDLDPSCDPNPCGPLEPPANLSATTTAPDRIYLQWEDHSYEESFIIERKTGTGGSWEVVQVVGSDTTEWEDSTVLEGRSYYYRVRGQAGEEESPLSNYVIALSGAPPAAPSNVVATALFPVLIRIDWTDHAIDEAGFKVERKRGEFGPWQQLQPYRPTNMTYFLDVGVDPDTEYTYRVRAYNRYGHSAYATSNVCYTPVDPGSFDAVIAVEYGTYRIPGALIEVDRGSGFTPECTTDENGLCDVTGLKLNDRLRASKTVDDWTTCRNYRHDQPYQMGRRLIRDSDVMDAQGYYSSFTITAVNSSYTLKLGHTLYRYDLGVSLEWDPWWGADIWTELEQGFQNASNYLYDVSDGQIALGRIAVWDAKENWSNCDVRIEDRDMRPHANVDQFLDCDDWSSEEHLFIGRLYYGAKPDEESWARSLTHELGHYAFGLWDEYMTGAGSQEDMWTLQHADSLRYPLDYGVMDHHPEGSEFSSKNDYLENYDYDCDGFYECAWQMTAQLFVNHKSCWDHIEEKLESASSWADLIPPEPGWYVAGKPTTADRDGPDDDIGLYSYFPDNNAAYPPITFDIHDSGPGSFGLGLAVRNEGGPVGGAEVYRVSGGQMFNLGRAHVDGSLSVLGIEEGDAIRIYARGPDGVVRSETQRLDRPAVEEADPLIVDTSRWFGRRRVKNARDETTAPGAAVDLQPIGTPEGPGVELSIWADEALQGNPIVIAHIGSAVQELVPFYDPELDRWVAEAEIDLSDSSFTGQGLFEIGLEDEYGNATFFTTPFGMGLAQANETLQIHCEDSDLTIQGQDVFVNQLLACSSSYTVPYRVAGFEMTPVTDLYSYHLVVNDDFPHSAGLNIGYRDSLLSGIDETSLVLHRWDPSTRSWSEVEGSAVSPVRNVVSAPIEVGGVYCVFAAAESFDTTSPGRIEDFGAVPAEGVGAVELLWTAPGDDDDTGACQQYIVAFTDSVSEEYDWAAASKLRVPFVPGYAGTPERIRVNLPYPGKLYYLAIRAKDEASNLGPVSNITYSFSGTADPNFESAPPVRMRAVDAPGDAGGAVRVTWNLSYDDGGGKETVTGYKIYRDEPTGFLPESLAVVPAGTSAFADSTAETNVMYTYWVSAVDSTGENMSLENRALAARNVDNPLGDFSSDFVVGVDDLSLLVDSYAIDSTDAEYDPLFDLDGDSEVYTADIEVFQSAFGIGGIPADDPPGENTAAHVSYEILEGEGGSWHLNLRVANASNLAGYSLRVSYSTETLAFDHATPDSAGLVDNVLVSNGGYTPVFVVNSAIPGDVFIANVIQRPSSDLAPEGGGFLAQVSFAAEDATPDDLAVTDIVLLDHLRGVNHTSGTSSTDAEVGTLRPFLYWSRPNPIQGGGVIRFQIPERSPVELRIYDVSGRLVRTLVDGIREPGRHNIVWDGLSDAKHRVASSVYFLRFKTTGYEQSRKVVVLR